MKINVEIKSLRLEFHKRKQEIQKHESQVVEINNEERIPKTRVVEITKKKANQQRRRRHIVHTIFVKDESHNHEIV